MTVSVPDVLDDPGDYAVEDMLDLHERLTALRERQAGGVGAHLRATGCDVDQLRAGQCRLQG